MTSSENDNTAGQGRAGEDEYGLRIEPESRPAEKYTILSSRLDEGEPPIERPAEEDEEAEEQPSPQPRDVRLRRLFLSGTFTFPFGLDVLGQTMTLIFGAAILVGMLKLALSFGSAKVGGLGGAGVGVVSMLMCALGGIYLLVSLIPASAWGLTVLRETSYGGERIEGWPGLMAFEGVADAIYLLFAALMSAVPGAFAASLTGGSGILAVLLIGLSQFFFFPLCLLSMLDNVSPLNPFSRAVWRSAISHAGAWGLFFALALGMAGLILLTDIVSRFAGLLVNSLAVGFVIGAVWMGYFRLLGRLTWLCSLSPADETPDESASEEDEEVHDTI